MWSSKFKDSTEKNANTANTSTSSLFYQAVNNMASIISCEPPASSSSSASQSAARPDAAPKFSSAHLDVSARKILARPFETTTKNDDLKQRTTITGGVGGGGVKRARADDTVDAAAAASSTTASSTIASSRHFLDKPPLFELFSLQKRARQDSTSSVASSATMKSTVPVSSTLSSSISVISSETRRLLRELERRNSPVTAAKRMRQDESDSKFFRPSSTEPESSSRTGSSLSTKAPPTSSLVTPYRAHVLPRLATLGRSPYARPLKETADKGVSVDMFQEIGCHAAQHNQQQRASSEFSTTVSSKSGSKMKQPGGTRNKFSTQFLDDDEPQIVYETELTDVPPLPLNRLPPAGFLSVANQIQANHKQQPAVDALGRSSPIFGTTGTTSRLSSGSPVIDTFTFSNPIVIANPAETSFSRSSSFGRAATSPQVIVENGPLTDTTISSSTTIKSTTAISSNGPISVTPLEPKWTCNTCFISNSNSNDNCLACGATKPGLKKKQFISSGSPEISTAKKFISIDPASQNFWTCNTCFIPNTADKKKCAACQEPKPGLGLQQEIKKPQIDSKQTWTCDTCFIPNTADKTKCAACQEPKPGSELPETKKPRIDLKQSSIFSEPTAITTTFTPSFGTGSNKDANNLAPAPMSGSNTASSIFSLPAASTTLTKSATSSGSLGNGGGFSIKFGTGPNNTSSNSAPALFSGLGTFSTAPTAVSASNASSSLFLQSTPTTTSATSITSSGAASGDSGGGVSLQLGAGGSAPAPLSGLGLFPTATTTSSIAPNASNTGSMFSLPSTVTSQTTTGAQPSFGSGGGFSFQFGQTPANPSGGLGLFQNAIPSATSSIPVVTSSGSMFSLPTTCTTAASVADSSFGTGEFSVQFGTGSNKNANNSAPAPFSGLGAFSTAAAANTTTTATSDSNTASSMFSLPAANTLATSTTSSGGGGGGGFSFQFGAGSNNISSSSAPAPFGGLGVFSTAPTTTSASNALSSLFFLPSTATTTSTTSTGGALGGSSGFSFQFGAGSNNNVSSNSAPAPFSGLGLFSTANTTSSIAPNASNTGSIFSLPSTVTSTTTGALPSFGTGGFSFQFGGQTSANSASAPFSGGLGPFQTPTPSAISSIPVVASSGSLFSTPAASIGTSGSSGMFGSAFPTAPGGVSPMDSFGVIPLVGGNSPFSGLTNQNQPSPGTGQQQLQQQPTNIFSINKSTSGSSSSAARKTLTAKRKTFARGH